MKNSSVSCYQFSGLQSPKLCIHSGRSLEHINQILDSDSPELGHLFIGNTITILNPQILDRNSIKSIVCCNKEAYNVIKCSNMPTKYNIKYINVEDHPYADISRFFNSCCQFIEAERSQGHNVLVQCHGGVSRSTTIIAAYMIQKQKWDLNKVLGFIRKKRERAQPNPGFYKQLQQYQQLIMNNRDNTQNPLNSDRPSSFGLELEIDRKNQLRQQKQNRMFSNIELLKKSDGLLPRNKVHFVSLTNSPTSMSYNLSSPKYDEYQMHNIPSQNLSNSPLNRVHLQTQYPANNLNNIQPRYFPTSFQPSSFQRPSFESAIFQTTSFKPTIFQPASFNPLNNRTRFISVPHQNGIRY